MPRSKWSPLHNDLLHRFVLYRIGRPAVVLCLAALLSFHAVAAEPMAEFTLAEEAASFDEPAESGKQADDLWVELGGVFLYGKIDGFLQTPRGGQPGTTSPERPTFGELGIDRVGIIDLTVSVHWQQHIFTIGGQFIRPNGSTVLTQDLVSQATFYPAGTRVDAEVKLDWYRIGYQYEFRFPLDEQGNQISFAPGLDAVIFDFDYQLRAAGGLRTDRSYRKGGLRIGATAEWLTGTRLSLEGGVFWSLPIDSTAGILSAGLDGRCQLWGQRQMAGGALYLGVAHEEIGYQDQQRVPNHINAKMGPLLVAGLEIMF